MCFPDSVVGFNAHEVESSELFMHYVFTYIKKHIQKSASGSIQDNINIDYLAGLEFKIPIKQYQDKITAVLSPLDSKIDCNNRINAELEAMAKALYDYWFVQFDFPDKNGKPYKSSGGKMVYNPTLKRYIPAGWGTENLLAAFDVCYGFPFDSSLFSENESQKPVVRIRDILDCSISAYTNENADDKYWLREQDLLIGMDGNFHMNFWSGRPALLNQRSVRFRKTANFSTMQAYFEISPYIKAREKNVSRTTVGHLSAKDIKSYNLLQAEGYIQKKATVFFDTMLAKICKNRSENLQLAKLRDWLLPMLMNGQATVE